MRRWKDCKNILCIRADNMGDVLMSAPAIKSLRNYTNSKITLLTSSKGCEAAKLNSCIDEVIVANLPWLKLHDNDNKDEVFSLLELIKASDFDGCVIFTVYSQSSLPAAMLAYLAGIPLRLAYCRENPYALLSHWVPEVEPYELIRHQVERDLNLVASIGAVTNDKRMYVDLPAGAWNSTYSKVFAKGLDLNKPYLILHTGVSEQKRKYPASYWIACGVRLAAHFAIQMLLTGSAEEVAESEKFQAAIGHKAVSVAGLLNVEEFAALIANAAVVVSVNTGTVHLASALQTPVVVLHAQTNPQHTPWMTPHSILQFSIPELYKSKNKVIEYVDQQLYTEKLPPPEPEEVVAAVSRLLALYKSSSSLKTML